MDNTLSVAKSNISTVESTRIEWVDIAKGLGIFLVIFLHSGAPVPFQVIFGAFHMPLFFILAGFFLFRKQTSSKDFFRNKFKSLMVPYFVFGVILASYSTLLDIAKSSDNIPGLRYIGLIINNRQPPFFGSLWFLLCLFSVEILLFHIHRKFKSKSVILSICTICFLMGVGILFYYGKGLPLCLDLTLICLIFCEIGYRLYPYLDNLNKWSTISILLVIFTISVGANYYLMSDSVDLYSSRIGNPFLFFIGGISGSIVTILLAKRIQINRTISYIGKNSLLYYCLQYLLILIVSRSLMFVLNQFSFIDTFASFISSIIASIIILFCLRPVINIINARFKWALGKF